ncbi:DUF899 domain-containing protein [Nocardioidaceae bacterium]|nr:DUF899 domain-containing protein [Nocardioidaceae bacterium]
MTAREAPDAAPPIVGRPAFDEALAAQIEAEKEVTRLGDRVSAARRRLPMIEVEDYEFTGPDGPVRLTELFGDHYLLLVQNVMYGADWGDEGCPSCTWATDNLPQRMGRFDEHGIAFAMVSQGPIEKLQAWREKQGWDHTWVSSGGTTYDDDWGWIHRSEGYTGPQPGYSYYLLRDGRPYLTYMTRARGTEAILPLAHIMDRTVYGRQQDWEDSPEGWPQEPTYG